MTQSTQISRDPFARTTLFRRTMDKSGYKCDWCGNTRKSGRLFRYYTEDDGLSARRHEHYGKFCSIGCFRSYHA